MNAKCYKVWKVLLDSPGEWIPLFQISEVTGLTVKQVVSVLIGLDPTYLERDEANSFHSVRLNGTPDDLARLRKEVVMDYYDISDEMMEILHAHLSPVGWVSVTDISNDTGWRINMISAALSVMDDVVKMTSGHTSLYSKVM